jgi:hypothetical protein
VHSSFVLLLCSFESWLTPFSSISFSFNATCLLYLLLIELAYAGLTYVEGDSLAVYPQNNPTTVDRCVALLKATGKEGVRTPERSKESEKERESQTLRGHIPYRRENSGQAKRDQARQLLTCVQVVKPMYHFVEPGNHGTAVALSRLSPLWHNLSCALSCSLRCFLMPLRCSVTSLVQ